MNHRKQNNILLQRSVIQCTEAAFDFLRQTRRNWVVGILLLVLPFSLLIAAIWLPEVVNRNVESVRDFIIAKLSNADQVVYLLPGFYLSVLFSCSLLKWSQDKTFLPDLSWRQILPVCKPNILRLFLAVMIIGVIVCVLSMSHFPISLVVLILLVPAWILIPSFLFYEKDSGNVLIKDLGLGFSKWFGAFFIEFFMGFIGLMMTVSVVLPCILLLEISDFMGAMSGTWGVLYIKVMSFVALSLGVLAVFAGASFVALGICFLYGSGVSENKDDIVSESIDNFENL